MISDFTLGVAVAVNAMIGIVLSIASIICLILRYSGLKSCPHSEIQCASSTATKDTPVWLKNSIFSSLVRVSGATYRSLVLPAMISSLTFLIWDLLRLLLRKCAMLSS